MIRIVKIFLTLFTLLIMTGCTPPVNIPQYRVTIAGITPYKAKKLEEALKKQGYIVRREREYTQGRFQNYETNTQTFVIKNKKLIFKDIERISSFILRNNKILDNVSLKSVQQYYITTSGEGSVQILLHLSLPKNSKACYRKTRKEIALKWDPKEKKNSFVYYNRKAREEYIDIYFVPLNKSCRSYKPKTFQRIYLSYPYQTETRPWKGGYLLPSFSWPF